MGDGRELILITGASGRIGFKCAEYFSQKYQVVGFDIFLVGSLPDVEFVAVDMATDESVKEGLDYVLKKYGNKIAAVVHLAAYYSFNGPNSSNYDRITVQGTHRLLEGLKQFTVGQFIFSSTMLIYKPTAPGIKITEDSQVEPTWGYPKSKVKTEALIHKERGNIPTVNLRIAGVYDDQCHSIPLSNQLQRVFENQLESHVFPGDVTHGSAFVHMDDVVEAIALCVEKRNVLPPELNLIIAEDRTLSTDELQRMMQRQIFGKEWKTWQIPKWFAKLGAWAQEHLPFFHRSFVKPWMIDHAEEHYEFDITKAKTFLGWEPKHHLDQVIAKWIGELKKDPQMWYDENKLKMPRKKKAA
jgi:nucleoside-diphosphate-sugar epimerase